MKLTHIASVVKYNFRRWHKNPRIISVFLLAFILCFLLSDKAVNIAENFGSTMQIVEAFVWTFGDSNSILLSSMLLLLLFIDMPFISSGTSLYLVRINRKTWVISQSIYVFLATSIYLLFILLSTAIVCMKQSFIGNMWSETAAYLGYSGEGVESYLPAFVTTLELSKPYQCMITIFILMLFYTVLMSSIMLFFNIWKGQIAGIISVFIFTIYGFLLNPQTILKLMSLPQELSYIANVTVGWLSPLNHATYHMHSFGYDNLPTLSQTYLIFGSLIVLFIVLTLRASKKYNFNFIGTEE